MSVLGTRLVTTVNASTLTPHAPIFIDDDSDFTPENGVTSGSGTAHDPYIIENWDINSTAEDCIHISNTRSHFVVRNVLLHDSDQMSNDGIAFSNVTSGRIEDSTIVLLRWGIRLVICSNNVVIRNNASDNAISVYLVTSKDNEVIDNSLSGNINGIYLQASSNINIEANNITSSGTGIWIESSSENNITRNIVTYSTGSGLLLYQGGGWNNIVGNILSSNDNGITVAVGYSSSYHNFIALNNITLNRGIGISLRGSYNTIIFNTIQLNRYGGMQIVESNGNAFYNNNFVNNTCQAVSYNSFNNVWDNGVEGNYWSNYTGTDFDHDGIGNSWHEIDASNIDHYPLMGMFSDFNATSEYHVQTVSNSSISDFKYNGTTISFNVTGENNSTGFCRLCIPKALMNETYRVFVNGTEILPAPEPLPCSNSTHNYIYFNYIHSEQDVVIIPEFPSFLILPIFMIATLVAVIAYRRKGIT